MKKIRKQKGGLKIKSKLGEKEAFDIFLERSSIKVLKGTLESGSGVIFVCTLHDGEESTYEPLRSHGEKVSQIIIKLVAVTDGNETKMWPGKEEDVKSFKNKKYVETIRAFQNEVDIQKEIFNKTKENLDPVCPALVYSKILTNDSQSNSATLFLEKLKALRNDDETVSILDDFINNIGVSIPSLGVIGMEMASGYRELSDFYKDKSRNDDNIRIIENAARLRILETAVKTGYSQNDFHTGNILVKADETNHILIIDFGFASKIPMSIIIEIREHIKNGDYVGALSQFKKLYRTDGKTLDNPSIYGWLFFRHDKLRNRTTAKPTFINEKNASLAALSVAKDKKPLSKEAVLAAMADGTRKRSRSKSKGQSKSQRKSQKNDS